MYDVKISFVVFKWYCEDFKLIVIYLGMEICKSFVLVCIFFCLYLLLNVLIVFNFKEFLWCVFVGKVIIYVLFIYICMGIFVCFFVIEYIDWIKCLGNFWMIDICIDFFDFLLFYEFCF